MKEEIRDFYGKILGYIIHESNGDLTIKDFNGVILGYYKKGNNTTTDFYGKVIAKGNIASGFLMKLVK